MCLLLVWVENDFIGVYTTRNAIKMQLKIVNNIVSLNSVIVINFQLLLKRVLGLCKLHINEGKGLIILAKLIV